MMKCGLTFCKALASGISKGNVLQQSKIKNVLFTNITRNTSFFNKLTAEELWRSHTSVSNAGKKRGRGRGTDKKSKINLYPKVIDGTGKANIFWPGLTGRVVESKTLVNIHKKPVTETETETTHEGVQRPSRRKIHPLARGWSGRKFEGKVLEPPDPIFDLNFPDFESITVENKIVAKVTALLGKKRRFAVTVLVGNKKGLIGLARGRGSSFPIAFRKGKNKAINELIAIDLIEKNTVNHDFYCEFGSSRLFVFKKPEGYGLKCHRALAVCCRLLGIKDIAINLEGSSNVLHIVKAFLLGLLKKQKSYQQIADETKLHVVQFRKETMFYPEVLASPDVCIQLDENQERPVFEHYVFDNQIILDKPRRKIWEKKSQGRRKVDRKVELEMLAAYGGRKSFLTDRYPECTVTPFIKKRE